MRYDTQAIFTSLARQGALIVLGVVASNAASAECDGVPRFIAMYGKWESVAVRAEPAAILEEHPEWADAHSIMGVPMDVCPAIQFIVEQEVDGEQVITQITYVFDASSNKSYGVAVSSAGVSLRAEISHGKDSDELTLLDSDGNPVWKEHSVWIADDEFRSESSFDFNGELGRVWFRTYRVAVMEKT